MAPPKRVAWRLAVERESVSVTVEEAQLLRGLVEGATLRELARELALNERTVRRHLTALYEKLGVASKTQCIAAAGRLRLV